MTFVLPSFVSKPEPAKKQPDKSKRGIALRVRRIRDTLHGQPHEVRRKVRALLEDVVVEDTIMMEQNDDQATME